MPSTVVNAGFLGALSHGHLILAFGPLDASGSLFQIGLAEYGRNETLIFLLPGPVPHF